MVDHQKTLYEVMKRGVDSDQKLNHAYATGLLKKKLRIFCNDYSFCFMYHLHSEKTANFDYYKYLLHFCCFQTSFRYSFYKACFLQSPKKPI